MDRPEELAKDYLEKKGYHPAYEPLGESTFPDFEIKKSIGVEVRRLNENYFDGIKPKPSGLRTVSKSIFDGIGSLFSEYTKSNPQQNFWVSLKIKRPVSKLKVIKKELKGTLNTLMKQELIQTQKIEVTDGIAFDLKPKTEITNQIFYIGSILDFDSGGFVIPNLLKNINYCIQQKAEKADCSSYKRLWLILIDEISYGLEADEKKYIVENIEKHPIWEKIIILNTLNGNEILTI